MKLVIGRVIAMAAVVLAVGIAPGKAGVIEGFESGPAGLASYHTFFGTNASIVAGAAHDGSYGLQFASGSAQNTDWYIRDDAAVQVAQGDTLSAWMTIGDPTLLTGSRVYFGFGASAGGTLSAVLAPNSGEFIIQNNSGFGFTDIDAVSQSYLADHWYKVNVLWGIGGNITAELYDSDGTTLLNTVSAFNNTITSGGIAFRGFNGPDNIDTICANGCAVTSVPEPMTLAVFGIGAAGAAAMRRRLKRSA